MTTHQNYLLQNTDIDEILQARGRTDHTTTITAASIAVISTDRVVVRATINGLDRETETTASEVVRELVDLGELPLAAPNIHWMPGGQKMIDVKTSEGTWNVSCDYIAETLCDAHADRIVEAMWKEDKDRFSWAPVW